MATLDNHPSHAVASLQAGIAAFPATIATFPSDDRTTDHPDSLAGPSLCFGIPTWANLARATSDIDVFKNQLIGQWHLPRFNQLVDLVPTSSEFVGSELISFWVAVTVCTDLLVAIKAEGDAVLLIIRPASGLVNYVCRLDVRAALLSAKTAMPHATGEHPGLHFWGEWHRRRLTRQSSHLGINQVA